MLHSAKNYNVAREVTYYKKKYFFSCVPVSQMTSVTDDIKVITGVPLHIKLSTFISIGSLSL